MTWTGWILGVFCCMCGFAFSLVFYRRAQHLSKRIQTLLETAIDGKMTEVHLDESTIAPIENDMWRYLHDRALCEQHLREDLAQFQSKISDVTHQAVMPISNIILYTDLLKEQVNDVEGMGKANIVQSLSAIQEEAKELDFLLERLAKYARTESELIHIFAVKQPLQPLLDIMMKRFQMMAASKGITFTMGKSDLSAFFDLKWTTEALANVIDNGLKYTPNGGTVTVSVDVLPTFIRINVEDTGIGILEEEQGAIFKRFYRSQRVSEQSGLGIGLYLAREVMKMQGGFIKVSSVLNQGSVFSLFFLKDRISQN